jgi:hypothetical protein
MTLQQRTWNTGPKVYGNPKVTVPFSSRLLPISSVSLQRTAPYRRQIFSHILPDSMTADNINSWSCYNVPGQDHQFCNIGDSIRVNLLSKEPAGGKSGNYMHVWFYGPNVYQGFQCCPTRFKADRAMDWLKTKYDGIYWNQRSFSRDTKCLIWGMETCEGCGHKCDYCDNKCHDVCPKGKC